MTASVVGLVLLAALLHATWNAVVKSAGDRFASFAVVMGTGGLCAAVVAPFVPLPARAAWPMLVASALLHGVYYVGLLRAYSHGDLGHVYPIARGGAPLLVAIASHAGVAELLSGRELAGAVLVSAGIFAIAWASTEGGTRSRRATAWALFTAVTIAAYTLADGLGGRRSGGIVGYVVWLNLLDTPLAVGAYLVLRRGKAFAVGRADLTRGVAGGLIAWLGYGIAIWAMSVAPIAHVATLRETSVLLAAVLGRFALREPFGARRLVGAAIVVGGIWLMNA